MRQIKPENVKSYMYKIASLKNSGDFEEAEKLSKLLSPRYIDLRKIILIRSMCSIGAKDGAQFFLIRVNYDYMHDFVFNMDIELAEKVDIWNKVSKELNRLKVFLEKKGFTFYDTWDFKYHKWILSRDYNPDFIKEMTICLHMYCFFGSFLLAERKVRIKNKINRNPFK